MIFLTDTMPSACPSCGADWSATNHSDFYAGASGQCKCGAMYQYVDTAQLVEASKLNKSGDLHRYAN